MDIKDLAPFLWPTVVLVIALLFKGEIKKFLQRFTSADEMTLKLGQLSMQAKAFQEMKGSVETVFPDERLTKDELNAFFDIKLKSLLSEIQRASTKTDPRNDIRSPFIEKIRITTETGDVFEGETFDISKAGISFKTKGRLGIFETVTIEPINPGSQTSEMSDLLDRAKIVRIELSKEGYHYGATVPPTSRT